MEGDFNKLRASDINQAELPEETYTDKRRSQKRQFENL